MEETILDLQKETEQEENSKFSLNKDIGTEKDTALAITEHKIKSLANWIKAEQIVTPESRQRHNAERCIKEAYPHRQGRMDLAIPKHVRFVSFDEKYLRHCLDFLEFKASDSLALVCSQAVSCGIAVNLKSSQMRILFENLESHENRRDRNELGSTFIQCPSAGGPGEWISASTEGNKNFRSIMNGPLPYHLGPLETDISTRRVGKIDVKGTTSNFTSSPSGLSFCPLHKPETATTRGNENYRLKSSHKRHASIVSVNSSHSDQSASSVSDSVSQGMLQCTWKNKIPYFVFSVDDQREAYVANLVKIESPAYKNIDCMYLFHSKPSSQSGHLTGNKGSELVGNMKVSSSMTLCLDNSKVVETEFVLFGTDGKNFGSTPNSVLTRRKNKGSPMKVVDVIRKKHLPKHRSENKFGGPSSVLDDLCDPCQDMSNGLDALGGGNLLESSPNLELAAILMKDQFHGNNQKKTVGGWGLKFLEKALSSSTDSSLEASTSPDGSRESCLRNSSDCSTSMTVLLPADFHGGSKTRNVGPSGLVERWRSGGHCDCGGWDIGCPLTILTDKSVKEATTQANALGECKSFDLFIEGSKQGVPCLKMVNIDEDLYTIHFHSTVSALQCFSMAVAKIHAQSPALNLHNSEKLKL